MSLFEAGRAVTHIPAMAREVYDVTGAGDTVMAALSLALAAGTDMRQAAVIANYAAGIVVGKRGTATVTRAELDQALRDGRV
jgi:D-beta-D-heptose 7-phosphate kinase/D-beta-D-heptose 1-phosphate adenosyltransferase